MAVGDTVSYGAYNVANNGTTDIQPGAGVEVVILNVEATQGASMEVYRTTDGTNFTKIETVQGGSIVGNWLATNTCWLRLKNTSGGTAGNYAQGRQVK